MTSKHPHVGIALTEKFGLLVKLPKDRLDHENVRSANIAELTGFVDGQLCFSYIAPSGTRVEQVMVE